VVITSPALVLPDPLDVLVVCLAEQRLVIQLLVILDMLCHEGAQGPCHRPALVVQHVAHARKQAAVVIGHDASHHCCLGCCRRCCRRSTRFDDDHVTVAHAQLGQNLVIITRHELLRREASLEHDARQ